MSSYILKADFVNLIRTADLDEILDETDSILDQAETEVISQVKNYIGEFYDIDTEIAKTTTDRNQFFLAQIKKAVLYNIYRRTGNNSIPEAVNQDYSDFMDWLEKVARKKISLGLDLMVDADGDAINRFRWGSENARTH